MLQYRLTTGMVAFLALMAMASLAGCTTYTWPDGSKETVLGVAPEDENKRYEEQQAESVRYRVPGEIPETQ
ncbi:hypothetical protein CZ787_17690 [Halomonas citrativorans]|uniref:DUF4124 domain-containing protein n=2 Tax=Halomonas citrativorans TaxID=2742612 RepID=A0A1R4I5I7_9GAMM|nr:hypothetical protein [Halomonas citrativorans]SJN14946.1 hypothetical protein CZ787_17690 [Halomonas citrativorans]